MVYVALLRGINVGGNRKIEMKRLKNVFEKAGMENVRTYINSGNVIFHNGLLKPSEIVEILEKVIAAEFGFEVNILLRNIKSMMKIDNALPASWINDQTTKCDIMFLWDSADTPKITDQLSLKPGIDVVKYVPGAIIWCVKRQYVTKSGMMQLAGTPLYQFMTIRNCNTFRKLLEIMKEVA